MTSFGLLKIWLICCVKLWNVYNTLKLDMTPYKWWYYADASFRDNFNTVWYAKSLQYIPNRKYGRAFSTQKYKKWLQSCPSAPGVVRGGRHRIAATLIPEGPARAWVVLFFLFNFFVAEAFSPLVAFYCKIYRLGGQM
jgi:hypothetical protein